MKKIDSDELKRIELNLLIKFDEICKENEFKYFLCGGTLLGAIRHKGFIPWDDDIDVLMPRPDYEKLLKFYKENQVGDIRFVSWKTGDSIYPFLKLVNIKTKVKEKYLDDKYATNVWIDIFPLDGMPDNDRIIERKYKKIKFYKMLLMTAYSESGKGATWYAKRIKQLLIPLCKRMNVTKLCDKLNKIAMEYSIETSPFVGGFLWGYGIQEKMPLEFLDCVEVEFEGHKFPAPKCWDYYLKKLYGDYMALPPEEERRPHDFEAWWREEN